MTGHALPPFCRTRCTSIIMTTVYPLQIVADGSLPIQPHDSHDWSLTLIVTPDEAIETWSTRPQPTGLNWGLVRPEQLQTIPALRRLLVDHETSEK